MTAMLKMPTMLARFILGCPSQRYRLQPVETHLVRSDERGGGVAHRGHTSHVAQDYLYPRSTSRSPRTSQRSSRERKLMPSRLVLSCPGCAIRAGTARSTIEPTVTRSSVTDAARVRPFA